MKYLSIWKHYEKGHGPLRMIDSSTQTEEKCYCHNEDEFDEPQLTALKWKDNLLIRFRLNSLPKKRKFKLNLK